MTILQRLAFDRIETLSKECYEILPKIWSDEVIELDTDKVLKLLDKLSEQQDWINALNREEHS